MLNFVKKTISSETSNFYASAEKEEIQIFFLTVKKIVYLPTSVQKSHHIYYSVTRERNSKTISDFHKFAYYNVTLNKTLQTSLIRVLSTIRSKLSRSRKYSQISKFARHTRLDKACYITCRNSRIQSLLRRTRNLLSSNSASLPHSILFERRIGRPYFYRLSIEPFSERFSILHYYAN